MAFTEREKAAEKALRHLTKTFYRMMSADVRIDLYGKDILTWNENEKIGMPSIIYYSVCQRSLKPSDLFTMGYLVLFWTREK